MKTAIKKGIQLREKIYESIREYLIGIEMSKVDVVQLINEIEKSIKDYKELEAELEAKYNSLCTEVEINLIKADACSESWNL
ncbi:MAG: hypothetical protein HC773_06185 [Scytonema sp. CRU_2_7]|nr:hypothetical protein [Scytonema sp. CRU_2_7]